MLLVVDGARIKRTASHKKLPVCDLLRFARKIAHDKKETTMLPQAKTPSADVRI